MSEKENPNLRVEIEKACDQATERMRKVTGRKHGVDADYRVARGYVPVLDREDGTTVRLVESGDFLTGRECLAFVLGMAAALKHSS